ncbi:hypothetical protein N7513_012493 [Penicillium frequentans]|nr:hypothetical protein N7513_012493 [Penicillium glabrum]
MNSSRKPTIMLLHGAFHWPDCFDSIAPLLKNAGYSVHNTTQFPSTGHGSSSSLQMDIDAVRAALLQILEGDPGQNNGNDCVLVMHSYGAVPAVQALQGLSSKERGAGKTAVVKLVYLTCNIPRVGESHLQQYGDWATQTGWISEESEPPVSINDDVARFIGSPDALYNGLDEEQQLTLYHDLKTQSALALLTPLEYAGYKEIPGWYLVTLKDKLMPPEFQKLCIEAVGSRMEHVEEINTGHSSFLVEPAAVTDFIIRAATSTGV